MKIVTVDEMRALETRAAQEYGLTSQILMENAGRSAAEILARYIAEKDSARSFDELEFLVLVGPGNNGGDGMVMARYLEQWGGHISAYHWKEQHLTVRGREIAAEDAAAALEEALHQCDYVLDALLGTGHSRPLPDRMRSLLGRVNQEREKRDTLRIAAVDRPTGLNPDTGEVDRGTRKADFPITLACPKRGFFFFPGREYIGELYVGDIGLPAVLVQDIRTEMLTGELVRSILPGRPLNSNKGTFGKVMLFCGSPRYPGSAFLGGSAASRIGAGLVTLAVTEQMLPIYAGSFHESTFLLLPEESAGSFERANSILNHLEGYRALLTGPGLGQSPYIREVLLDLLESLRAMPDEKRPYLVIDADGLNNLSALESWWTLMPKDKVITPPPGEMGRLCKGVKVSGGGIDRLWLARSKAAEWQVTLVLKGACTIIVEPSGCTRINWQANPALATAGTGDVLAGVIARLVTPKGGSFYAARAARFLHTTAFEPGNAGDCGKGVAGSDLAGAIS